MKALDMLQDLIMSENANLILLMANIQITGTLKTPTDYTFASDKISEDSINSLSELVEKDARCVFIMHVNKDASDSSYNFEKLQHELIRVVDKVYNSKVILLLVNNQDNGDLNNNLVRRMQVVFKNEV